MKAHYLQHVPFEGIGSIEGWLSRHGVETSRTRLFQDEHPTDVERMGAADLLVVMGGPMSVNDEAVFPWLSAEKRVIRDAILRGVRVLGICLGAQLIASALGARVYRNPVKEIGWFPVRAATGAQDLFRFPPVSSVFHWHGETFDLPPGAVPLASSECCSNQAFQIDRRVVGLQFHLEVTRAQVRAMVDACGGELVAGPRIQTEAELLAVPDREYARTNRMMDQVLDDLTGLPSRTG